LIGSANFSTWFPQAASTHARGVDGLYYGIYVAAVFVLILFAGLALAYFYQFRRQDPEGKGEAGRRLNPFLLGVWVLGAVGLGLFAYVGGIPGFVDQTVAPYGAYRIHANARPGGWDFTYPNGSAADTLRVRAGQPVQLSLTSADPGYSLTIPALRINQAILPGHDNRTWFTVDVPGEFPLRSNVFNGADHDSTATALVALSEQDFDT
jgi:heme/copper-type cytochrome/quinol oxidase subunit 2